MPHAARSRALSTRLLHSLLQAQQPLQQHPKASQLHSQLLPYTFRQSVSGSYYTTSHIINAMYLRATAISAACRRTHGYTHGHSSIASCLTQHLSTKCSTCEPHVQLLPHIFGQWPALHKLLCIVRQEVANEVLLIV
jgi:hypothetical protein